MMSGPAQHREVYCIYIYNIYYIGAFLAGIIFDVFIKLYVLNGFKFSVFKIPHMVHCHYVYDHYICMPAIV